MMLRYTIDNKTELAEIIRMYHSDDNIGHFVLINNTEVCITGIYYPDWLRLISDMFSDGKLSLPVPAATSTSYIFKQDK